MRNSDCTTIHLYINPNECWVASRKIRKRRRDITVTTYYFGKSVKVWDLYRLAHLRVDLKYLAKREDYFLSFSYPFSFCVPPPFLLLLLLSWQFLKRSSMRTTPTHASILHNALYRRYTVKAILSFVLAQPVPITRLNSPFVQWCNVYISSNTMCTVKLW